MYRLVCSENFDVVEYFCCIAGIILCIVTGTDRQLNNIQFFALMCLRLSDIYYRKKIHIYPTPT